MPDQVLNKSLDNRNNTGRGGRVLGESHTMQSIQMALNDIKKDVIGKPGEFRVTAYFLMGKALEIEEFELLLPKDREKLRNELKEYIKKKRARLSKPLNIKLTDKWNEEDLTKAVTEARQAHEDAQEFIEYLRSEFIDLSSVNLPEQ